ncbi:MAG TPA: HEAT repeat domain-containing protein [Gemmataceae bacterium]|nr:HEAT repeat domain-containing protein [Gemmataceae bacterium]
MRFAPGVMLAAAVALLIIAGQPAAQTGSGGNQQLDKKPQSAEEDILLAAGLSADGDALLEFFRDRMQTKVDLEQLLALARQLGDANANTRSKASAQLIARGPWAIPALRYVLHDLDDQLARKQASHCLEWIEGKHSAELPIAAAKLLAQRNPKAAATLLAYLPFADDEAVVEGVKTALALIAARPGQADAALMTALSDSLPLRRAIACEVLAESGPASVLPQVRKLLADPKPRVRLRAALALTKRMDEPAVGVLIDLLVELPVEERKLAEQALQQLAGEWAPNPPLTGDDDLSRKVRREAWAAWWRTVDGPALLAAFRQRTLSQEDIVAALAFIDHLGDASFSKREKATTALIAQGSKVLPLLRAVAAGGNLEKTKRVESCLKQITLNAARDKLPLSAPRLLALREPARATETLLGYVPYTDDRSMQQEIVKCLTNLLAAGGNADVAVVNALSDSSPLRRITAAEVLAATGGGKHLPAIRKLLKDKDAEVRLRVAMALVHALDKQGVPALIELLAVMPRDQTWEVEQLLYRLAGDAAPPAVAGDDASARKKLSDAWQAWWKHQSATVDLAHLAKMPSGPSLIVVAELGPNGNANMNGGIVFGGGGKAGGVPLPAPIINGPGADRIVAVDRNGKTHWQIDNLGYPVDFHVLPGNRVLIAEYTSRRVTERDLKGNIVWEVSNLPSPPMNVQRLANGNSFIAMYGPPGANGGYLLQEVDKQGKTVATFNGGGIGAAAENPRAGYKLPDGRMVAFSIRTCIWLDATGKEVKRLPVPLMNYVGAVPSSVGNLDVTSKGNIVFIQSDNTVAEYDPDGKLVWQVKASGNRATRLANGNTLVASEATGVFELDPAGKTVWKYEPPAGYQAARARPSSEWGFGVANPVTGLPPAKADSGSNAKGK